MVTNSTKLEIAIQSQHLHWLCKVPLQRLCDSVTIMNTYVWMCWQQVKAIWQKVASPCVKIVQTFTTRKNFKLNFIKFTRLAHYYSLAVTSSLFVYIRELYNSSFQTALFTQAKCCLHTVRQKKEPIFFCVHPFNAWQNLVIFFTCIEESMSYNSVYLILACAKNFV